LLLIYNDVGKKIAAKWALKELMGFQARLNRPLCD